jgi:hypothetical protein
MLGQQGTTGGSRCRGRATLAGRLRGPACAVTTTRTFGAPSACPTILAGRSRGGGLRPGVKIMSAVSRPCMVEPVVPTGRRSPLRDRRCYRPASPTPGRGRLSDPSAERVTASSALKAGPAQHAALAGEGHRTVSGDPATSGGVAGNGRAAGGGVANDVRVARGGFASSEEGAAIVGRPRVRRAPPPVSADRSRR